jgi:hypothetical protein
LKRVSANVAVAGVLTSLGLFLITAAPVFADANPNNHGHHYGQIKHPKPVPVPTPSPAPAPALVPAPASAPAPSHPGIVSASPAAAPVQLPANGLIPVSNVPVAQPRTAYSTPAAGNPLWWLLLTILPALFAAWLIAFRILMGGVARRFRPAPRPATAVAPA